MQSSLNDHPIIYVESKHQDEQGNQNIGYTSDIDRDYSVSRSVKESNELTQGAFSNRVSARPSARGSGRISSRPYEEVPAIPEETSFDAIDESLINKSFSSIDSKSVVGITPSKFIPTLSRIESAIPLDDEKTSILDNSTIDDSESAYESDSDDSSDDGLIPETPKARVKIQVI